MIDFGVSQQEQMLLDAAERFAKERLKPLERQHEKEHAFSSRLFAEYDELGFARMGFKEQYGGLDLPLQTRAQAWAQIAGGDPAAPFALDPWGPAASFLQTCKTSEVGELVKEPAPARMGFVVPADGMQLTGGKCTGSLAWIPRKEIAWLLIAGPNGVALVKKPQCKPISDRVCGLQACDACEVTLNASPCTIIGDASASSLLLNEARIFAASTMLGAARDALVYAQRYSQERVAFGKPIAHHQGVAFMLVECAADLDGAALLLQVAAGRVDRTAEVANAYALAAATAHRVAERSVQTLGGHGYLYDHSVEKRMRDIRSIASLYGGVLNAETRAAECILEMNEPVEAEA